MFQVEKIRDDFSILKKKIIYLDNAASSLTPEPVLNRMIEFYQEYRSNIGRGVYRISQVASDEYEKARAKISGFINASNEEVIIVKNSSEGINLIVKGMSWNKNDNIVTTNIEHHSNFVVLLYLRNKYGVKLKIVNADKKGFFNINDFEKVIDEKTKLVCMTQVSNVIGTITPIEKIAKIAHEKNALFLVDGAQSVPHMSVDVKKIDCDFLAFSGHKMCGPTGIGCLYIRKELINKIEPLCFGGGAIKKVSLDSYQLMDGPLRFEAGTPPIAEAIGLGYAVDYLNQLEMGRIESYEKELCKAIHEGLSSINGVKIYGPEPDKKLSIISFNIKDLNPNDVALALDISSNIMVRSGFHCAMPIVQDVLGAKNGTVRASTYFYNTTNEVNDFISSVSEIAG